MKPERKYLKGKGRPVAMLNTYTHLFRCPWCRKGKPTHVEFFALGALDEFEPARGWPLGYPGTSDTTVCVVSHEMCGPDNGYWFTLDDLASDPSDWFRHLKEKDWSRGFPLRDVISILLLAHRDEARDRFCPPGERLVEAQQPSNPTEHAR